MMKDMKEAMAQAMHMKKMMAAKKMAKGGMAMNEDLDPEMEPGKEFGHKEEMLESTSKRIQAHDHLAKGDEDHKEGDDGSPDDNARAEAIVMKLIKQKMSDGDVMGTYAKGGMIGNEMGDANEKEMYKPMGKYSEDESEDMGDGYAKGGMVSKMAEGGTVGYPAQGNMSGMSMAELKEGKADNEKMPLSAEKDVEQDWLADEGQSPVMHDRIGQDQLDREYDMRKNKMIKNALMSARMGR